MKVIKKSNVYHQTRMNGDYDSGSKLAQSSFDKVPLDFVVCAGLEGVSIPPITGNVGVDAG